MREGTSLIDHIGRTLLVGALATLTLAASEAAQAVTIEMFASPAVNRFFSPTWSDWRDNARTALDDGLGSIGNPATDPDAYYTVTEFEPTDIAVTTFESWKGNAPGASPFHEEHGQRLHFPVLIESETGLDDIKLENIGNLGLFFKDTDQSASEVTVFDFATNPFGSYSDNFIGVKADGTVINSGSPDQLVNKLIYVSLGMAWADDDPGLGIPQGPTDQDTLDALLAELGDGSVEYIRATLSYFDAPSGGNELASDEIVVTPEPGTGLLLGLGVLGLGCYGRGRRATRS